MELRSLVQHGADDALSLTNKEVGTTGGGEKPRRASDVGGGFADGAGGDCREEETKRRFASS